MTHILLILLSTLFLRGGDDDPQEIISRIQKKYDGVKDATVSFDEVVRFGATQSEVSFAGTLTFRKGGKYRVDTEQETIVTDGASIWSFNKSAHQLFIDKYKEDPLSVSPDRVLVTLSDRYSATSLGTEANGKKTLTILKLLPKERKSRVRWMKVWVDTDEWLIRKVQVFDLGENLSTYSVREARFNPGVPDAQFTFPTPPGAEVIDLR